MTCSTAKQECGRSLKCFGLGGNTVKGICVSKGPIICTTCAFSECPNCKTGAQAVCHVSTIYNTRNNKLCRWVCKSGTTSKPCPDPTQRCVTYTVKGTPMGLCEP